MEFRKHLSFALGSLFFFLPVGAFAAIAAPWNATSTDRGSIQPTLINGNNPWLKISSTGTSTFTNGLDLSGGCFAIGGTCLSTGLSSYDAFTHPAYGGSATTSLMTFGDGIIAGSASSTISASNLHLGSLSGGLLGVSNEKVYSFASSSLFGYVPLNPTRQITIAGTANQITSSAGAQDLSADRTWTLSIPSQFNIQNASTTNFSANTLAVGGTGTTSISAAGTLTAPSAIIGSLSGLIGGNAGLLYGFASSSLFGFTPASNAVTITGTYPITGGGDLSASRVLALAFGTTTANIWSALQTFSNSSTTLASFGYASSTVWRGGGLTTDCDTGASSKLLWDATTGQFSCGTDQTGGGSGSIATSTGETAGNLPYWTSTNGTPATLGKVATTTLAFSGPFSGTGGLGTLVGGSNSTVAWSGLATTSQPSSSNLLVSNGAAGVYGVATSTLTATSPLTGSFVQIGSGGALGCQTASGSQAGCLASADWTSFNNKISSSSLSVSDSSQIDLGYTSSTGVFTASIVADSIGDTQLAFNTGQNLTTASSPTFAALTLSAPLPIASGGTGTTTSPVSQLLYGGSGSVYQSVATSSFAVSSAFSYSGTLGALVGGSGGTLSLATNGVALTNIAQIAANTVLVNQTGGAGNVTALATSTFANGLYSGTAGQVLARLSNGTWTGVATTTFSTGLTYSATTNAVTVNTSQNIATLSNLTTDGVIYTSGSAGTLNVDSGALDVARGGTGQASFTSSQLVYGNGTAALSSVATSSLTFSGPFAGISTLGALVGGSASTITWSGLATSTAIAANQVLYGTSASGVGAESAFTYNPTTNLFTTESATTTNLTVGTFFQLPNSTSQSPTLAGACAFDTTSGQLKCGDGTNTRVLSNGSFYPAFTYATSSAWTGTTTIPLGPAYVAETWNGIQCFTDAGTLQVSVYDGTNRMNWMNASTTVGIVGLTTNNTFTQSEKRYVDVGTPASSPTKISCTVSKAITAD